MSGAKDKTDRLVLQFDFDLLHDFTVLHKPFASAQCKGCTIDAAMVCYEPF